MSDQFNNANETMDTSEIPIWYYRFDDLRGTIGTLERIIEKLKGDEKNGGKWVDMEFVIQIGSGTRTYTNESAMAEFKKWDKTI